MIRRFACWLGLHSWGLEHDPGHGFLYVCRHCPAERSNY